MITVTDPELMKQTEDSQAAFFPREQSTLLGNSLHIP